MRGALKAAAAMAIGAGAAVAAAAAATALGRRDDRFVPTMFGMAHLFTTRAPNGRPVRVLSLGGGWQTVMYLDDPDEPAAAYAAGFDLVLDEALPKGPARSVLVIGGAGCAWPRHAVAADEDVAVTVVEIDPAMVAVARNEFCLGDAERRAGTLAGGEPRLRVVVGDGMDYLAQRASKRNTAGEAAPFDAVINDAYAGTDAPEALLSPAGLSLAKECLTPDGLYVVNVVCSPVDPTPVLAARDALLGAFAHVWDVPCPDPLAEKENHLLVASDREARIAGAFAV
ncbi:fused MFS/spermidine synthase [Atopobiaceae bacterium 24-176]